MTKKQRALVIIERLKKEYPDAACTLDYEEAWKLLVSVRLAAQCTDARVNVIVKGLFEKYPDVKMVVTETGEEVLPDNTFLSETQVKVSFDEYTPAENEFTVIIRR